MEEAFRTSTGPNQSVLLVSSDIALVALLEQALPTVLLQASSAAEAQSFFGSVTDKNRPRIALVMVDLDSLPSPSGIELLSALHQEHPRLPLLALLTLPSYDLAVLAIRSGASDMILKGAELLPQLELRIPSLLQKAQAESDDGLLLYETGRLAEELLYKLTDTARRVGELRALLSHQAGSPLPPEEETCRVLLVEEDEWLTKALPPLLANTFKLTTVVSGGAALDQISERQFDLALVKENLPDLPGRMVARTLSAQAPETLVLMFTPPLQKRPGRLDRIEAGRFLALMNDFLAPSQIADRLGEMYQAQLARRRERRYLAEFRAENYDLLRRFAELRRRLRDSDIDTSRPSPSSTSPSGRPRL